MIVGYNEMMNDEFKNEVKELKEGEKASHDYYEGTTVYSFDAEKLTKEVVDTIKPKKKGYIKCPSCNGVMPLSNEYNWDHIYTMIMICKPCLILIELQVDNS